MDALQIVTLVVAIIGAVTGVAALVWEAVTFMLSGSRVKVELKQGWVGQTGAVVGVPGTWPLGEQPSEGLDLECLAVQVRSVGRLPASVTGWSVSIGDTELGFNESMWNKRTPHRLDAGEENSWFVELARARQVVRLLKRGPLDVRARVTLGDGRVMISRNSLRLSP